VEGSPLSSLGLDQTFSELVNAEDALTEGNLSSLLSQLQSLAGGARSDRATRVRSQVTRTITELQANQLLAFQQEQVFSLRNIEAVLRSGLSVPDSIGATSGGNGGTVYNVNIDTIEGDADAESVVRKLEQELQQSNL